MSLSLVAHEARVISIVISKTKINKKNENETTLKNATFPMVSGQTLP